MDTQTLAAAPRTAGPSRTVHRWASRAAWAAAAWAVLFSAVHLYWLLGGRVGLPAGLSLRDNLPLLVIDILAVPLCAAAAVPALATVRPWGRRLPGRLTTVGLWATTALLLLHAAPSVPDWAALAVGARTTADLDPMNRFATLLYEPFFMTGGLLFALTTLGRRRS